MLRFSVNHHDNLFENKQAFACLTTANFSIVAKIHQGNTLKKEASKRQLGKNTTPPKQ